MDRDDPDESVIANEGSQHLRTNSVGLEELPGRRWIARGAVVLNEDSLLIREELVCGRPLEIDLSVVLDAANSRGERLCNYRENGIGLVESEGGATRANRSVKVVDEGL